MDCLPHQVSLELEAMRSGVEQHGAAARSREGESANLKLEIANLKLEIASLRDEGAQLRRQMQRARDEAELEQKDASRRAERIEMRAVEAERDATKQAARATDDFVHDKPWTAVGIGAAVGMIIGLLIARR